MRQRMNGINASFIYNDNYNSDDILQSVMTSGGGGKSAERERRTGECDKQVFT